MENNPLDKENSLTPQDFKNLHPDLGSISSHGMLVITSAISLLLALPIVFFIPEAIESKDYSNVFHLLAGVVVVVFITATLLSKAYKSAKEFLHASWIIKTVTPIEAEVHHSTFDVGDETTVYIHIFTFAGEHAQVVEAFHVTRNGAAIKRYLSEPIEPPQRR